MESVVGALKGLPRRQDSDFTCAFGFRNASMVPDEKMGGTGRLVQQCEKLSHAEARRRRGKQGRRSILGSTDSSSNGVRQHNRYYYV